MTPHSDGRIRVLMELQECCDEPKKVTCEIVDSCDTGTLGTPFCVADAIINALVRLMGNYTNTAIRQVLAEAIDIFADYHDAPEEDSVGEDEWQRAIEAMTIYRDKE